MPYAHTRQGAKVLVGNTETENNHAIGQLVSMEYDKDSGVEAVR